MTPKDEEDIYQAQPELIIPSEERAQFIPPPIPVEPEELEEVVVREPSPAPVIEPEPEPEKDELASLFEVPQPEDNDMATDHLFEVGEDLTGFEDDDLSDLVDVSVEDIMGDNEDYPGAPPSTELPQRAPVRRFKRTPRRYPPPPTSLGGLRQ